MHLGRACVICAVATGIALAGTVVAPQIAAARPPDRVTGSGTVEFLFGDLRVNAHSGPVGENPGGVVKVDTPGSQHQVKVSCMVVSGASAIVGGLDQDGFEYFVIVQDNGPSGDLANAAAGAQGPEPDQARCVQIAASVAVLSPVVGDFTVSDN